MPHPVRQMNNVFCLLDDCDTYRNLQNRLLWMISQILYQNNSHSPKHTEDAPNGNILGVFNEKVLRIQGLILFSLTARRFRAVGDFLITSW